MQRPHLPAGHRCVRKVTCTCCKGGQKLRAGCGWVWGGGGGGGAGRGAVGDRRWRRRWTDCQTASPLSHRQYAVPLPPSRSFELAAMWMHDVRCEDGGGRLQTWAAPAALGMHQQHQQPWACSNCRPGQQLLRLHPEQGPLLTDILCACLSNGAMPRPCNACNPVLCSVAPPCPCSVDGFSERSVFSRGKGSNLNIDCHRAGEGGKWRREGGGEGGGQWREMERGQPSGCPGTGERRALFCHRWPTSSSRACIRPAASPAASRAGPHSHLFSDLDFGLGDRPFRSGGFEDRGAHSGEQHGQQGQGAREQRARGRRGLGTLRWVAWQRSGGLQGKGRTAVGCTRRSRRLMLLDGQPARPAPGHSKID